MGKFSIMKTDYIKLKNDRDKLTNDYKVLAEKLANIPKEHCELVKELFIGILQLREDTNNQPVMDHLSMKEFYNHHNNIRCNWDENWVDWDEVVKCVEDHYKSKQVIVVRKDLNLSLNELCSYVAEASSTFLTKGMVKKRVSNAQYGKVNFLSPEYPQCNLYRVEHWLDGHRTREVVGVDNEEELIKIHQKALKRYKIAHLIENNGVNICCAIGPDNADRFNDLTDHLQILQIHDLR